MFVHRHSEGKEQFDRVTAAVKAAPELVRLGLDGRGQERFTSRAMLDTEQRLERATAALEASRRHGVTERHQDVALARSATRGMTLSAEQRSAFEHVTRGQGLSVVIGYTELPHQSIAFDKARQALDAMRPDASRNLRAAFKRDMGLIDEAAQGRADAMIARSRSVVEQNRELVRNRIGFAVAGMVLFAILPGAVARSLPVSWAMPERIAARMLGTDMWNAGQVMMAKADPERWRRIVAHEGKDAPPPSGK